MKPIKLQLTAIFFGASFFSFLFFILLSQYLIPMRQKGIVILFLLAILNAIHLCFILYYLLNKVFHKFYHVAEDYREVKATEPEELQKLSRILRVKNLDSETSLETHFATQYDIKRIRNQNKILRELKNIPVPQNSKYDISIFPKSTEFPKNQFACIVPFNEGLVGGIFSFGNESIHDLATELRIRTVFDAIYTLRGSLSFKTIWKDFLDYFLEFQGSAFKGSVFSINEKEKEIYYLHFQDSPYYLLHKGRVEMLEKCTDATHRDGTSLFQNQYEPGDSLIFYSDTTLDTVFLASVHKDIIESNAKNPTREILIPLLEYFSKSTENLNSSIVCMIKLR